MERRPKKPLKEAVGFLEKHAMVPASAHFDKALKN
jgi:hypothetical protein